jgi:tRNA(Arg) A34 adenosine deaminase TadA
MENYLDRVGFFRLARLESEKSTHDIRVGAVLANARPTARGYNKIKSHPIWANPDKHVKISIHAEVACIIDSSTQIGDTIYVYRVDKAGWPAMARPCIDCLRTLKEYGVRKMYYSIPHPPYYTFEEVT